MYKCELLIKFQQILDNLYLRIMKPYLQCVTNFKKYISGLLLSYFIILSNFFIPPFSITKTLDH